MKITAQIISWVFVPLLTPLYAFLAAMYIPSEQALDIFGNADCLYALGAQQKQAFALLFFFFSALLPAVIFINLRAHGYISTIEIDDRRERNLPIVLTFLSCLLLYIAVIFLLRGNPAPKFVFALPLSGMAASVGFYLLTQWKKVSLHTGGAGIMTGFVLSYAAQMESHAFWLIICSVVISGLVGSARIYLGKHTLLEVTVGWFTGLFFTFGVNYFY